MRPTRDPHTRPALPSSCPSTAGLWARWALASWAHSLWSPPGPGQYGHLFLWVPRHLKSRDLQAWGLCLGNISRQGARWERPDLDLRNFCPAQVGGTRRWRLHSCTLSQCVFGRTPPAHERWPTLSSARSCRLGPLSFAELVKPDENSDSTILNPGAPGLSSLSRACSRSGGFTPVLHQRLLSTLGAESFTKALGGAPEPPPRSAPPGGQTPAAAGRRVGGPLSGTQVFTAQASRQRREDSVHTPRERA